jgi:hypothetical protein
MPDDFKIDEQNDGFPPQPSNNNLNKNQKIAAAGLAIFAVLIVLLWSVQLKNNIYGPFNSNTGGVNESAPVDSQTANDLALKNKDTDADGLSDYDELNLYKTSPYLTDSDGDGANDGDEIKKGTDPNCPAGRTCLNSEFENGASAATGTPAASGDVLNNLLNQNQSLNNLLNQSSAANPAAGSAAGSGTGDLTDEQKQALKGLDAASLRQMLISSGMDKATLDQISDAELMQSYSETLQ